jgi:hypothetical protein
MPSTHLTSHSDPSTTRERVRTGIIVSVVVGTFALLILAYVLVKRRMNRNVKAGVVVGKKSYLEDTSRGKDDAGLEVGVVEEELLVYVREEKDGGREGNGGGRGVRC